MQLYFWIEPISNLDVRHFALSIAVPVMIF